MYNSKLCRSISDPTCYVQDVLGKGHVTKTFSEGIKKNCDPATLHGKHGQRDREMGGTRIRYKFDNRKGIMRTK